MNDQQVFLFYGTLVFSLISRMLRGLTRTTTWILLVVSTAHSIRCVFSFSSPESGRAESMFTKGAGCETWLMERIDIGGGEPRRPPPPPPPFRPGEREGDPANDHTISWKFCFILEFEAVEKSVFAIFVLLFWPQNAQE